MVQQQPQKRRFSLGVGRASQSNKASAKGSGSKQTTNNNGSPSKEELTAAQAHSSSSPPETQKKPSAGSGGKQKQQRAQKPSASASSSSSPQWDMTAIQEDQQQQQQSQHRSAKKQQQPRMRSAMKAQHVASSAGTNRLNRILHQPSEYRVSYVGPPPPAGSGGTSPFDDVYLGDSGNVDEDLYQFHRNQQAQQLVLKDVRNAEQVGRYVAKVVTPPLQVDSHSIGGTTQQQQHRQNFVQECLVSMPCKNFEQTGSERISLQALQDPNGFGKHKRSLTYASTTAAKHAKPPSSTNKAGGSREKVRYVCLVRVTNRPLLKEKARRKAAGTDSSSAAVSPGTGTAGTTPTMRDGGTVTSSQQDNDDDNEVDDYDVMFGDAHEEDEADDDGDEEDDEQDGAVASDEKNAFEISGFPILVCVTFSTDGSNPDIKRLTPLDQLTIVQNASTGSVLQLVFQEGDSVTIDFASSLEEDTPAAGLRKERFTWSILQIHAMLCMSVVERNSLETSTSSRLLPPLNVRNLDRAELQYIATVNGFLRDSPTLCALLDRQRDVGPDGDGGGQHGSDETKEEMDGMAYDMMMGNFSTRVAIFHSVEERVDAEEVLNGEQFRMQEEAEEVSLLLQRRMHDLEAETCRRLIAWEDEKHYNLIGQSSLFNTMAQRDTVDALSLASLFTTLNTLDNELKDMEAWLEERAAVIQPLTDDCRDIEEENRQLEQQWKSYDMLGAELRRILQGVEVARELERVLKNPASALVYDASGSINVKASERGVDKIHEAGQALKQAMDNANKAGGVHLRAVSERVEGLTATSSKFCTALAQIVVTVMEELKTEVVAGSDGGKVSKSDTHGMIAKKIRDTQRKFQSALLGYMNLIEVLALLKPQVLPAIRDAYSEMVSEGILMKKRMKGYFQALPGKNAAYTQFVARDLKDYTPTDAGSEKTVNASDMGAALGELLPVIAREAYFTAALFGLSKKALDGREKKRNFESAKRSVDHSTQNFRYYIQRTCGIIQEGQVDPSHPNAARLMRGDSMLSLVASIYLNEAMEQYIDVEKKGGDHSLSLAYVRATILGLRKKVDKQWVAWVEEQIDWIKTHPGVPLSGKKAGVFVSFSNFPLYLDHILRCCKEGKPEDYSPDLSNIQVVSYYLQKMANALLDSLRICSERESTDQIYAANVMRMENTYFFTQRIKACGPEIATLFHKQLTKASAVCKQSTDAYLGWMIKREFKALHALFAQISRVRRDVGDKDVSIHVPRSTFVKTLQKESSREVLKEKIGSLYGRMEKHLSEDGGLLPIAWKALVKVLYEWFGRWEKLSSQCYKHVMDPSAVDVVRIAKQAGGGTKTTAAAAPTTKQKPQRPARDSKVSSRTK